MAEESKATLEEQKQWGTGASVGADSYGGSEGHSRSGAATTPSGTARYSEAGMDEHGTDYGSEYDADATTGAGIGYGEAGAGYGDSGADYGRDATVTHDDPYHYAELEEVDTTLDDVMHAATAANEGSRLDGEAGREKKKKKKKRAKKFKKSKRRRKRDDDGEAEADQVSVGFDPEVIEQGIQRYYVVTAGQEPQELDILTTQPDNEHDNEDLTDSDDERKRQSSEAMKLRRRLAEEARKRKAEGKHLLQGMIPMFDRFDKEQADGKVGASSDDSDAEAKAGGSDSDEDSDGEPAKKYAMLSDSLRNALLANDHTMLLDDDMTLKSNKELAKEKRQRWAAELRKLDRLGLAPMPTDLQRGTLDFPLKRKKLRIRQKLQDAAEARLAAIAAKRREEVKAELESEEEEMARLMELEGPTWKQKLRRKVDKELVVKRKVGAAVGKAAMELPQDFRPDHDIRYREGLRDGDAEPPWKRPSRDMAWAARVHEVFRAGRGNCCRVASADLQELGHAPTQYFFFLKHLAIIFLVMTLLTLPTYSLMAGGTGQLDLETNGKYGDGDEIGWAAVTIGNLRDTSIERDIVGDLVSKNTTHDLPASDGSVIPGDSVSWQIAMNDIITCVVFLLYLVYMRYSTAAVSAEIDANIVTTARYAVLVRGLPADATEHELRRHFSDLYQLAGPDWEVVGVRACCEGRKRSRPVKSDIQLEPPDETGFDDLGLRKSSWQPVADPSNTRDGRYFGSWVSEVAMVYRDGHALRRYLARSEVVARLEAARARVKKYSVDTVNTFGPSSCFRDAALCRLRCLDSQVNRLASRYTGRSPEASAATVIFNNHESYLRCMADYANSKYMLARAVQKSPLRLRGRHALQVEAAGEPRDVRWENLDTPPRSRFMRRSCTNILATALVVTSFLFLLFCHIKRDEFRTRLFPHDTLCNLHLPAALYGQYIDNPAPVIIRTPTPGICPLPTQVHFSYAINVTTDAYPEYKLWDLGVLHEKNDFITHTEVPTIPFSTLYDYTNITCHDDLLGVRGEVHLVDGVKSLYKSVCQQPHPCNRPCLDLDDTTTCTTLICQDPRWAALNPNLVCNYDTTGNYTIQTIKQCYCKQALFRHVNDLGGFLGWVTLLFWAESLCQSYMNEFVFTYAVPYLAVFLAVAVNWLLKVLLQYMVKWVERHPTRDHEAYALGSKLFWFQITNSAVVILLVYMKAPGGVELPSTTQAGTSFSLFNMHYTGFSPGWYSVVGNQIMLTLLLLAIVPHLNPLFATFFWRPLRRCCNRTFADNQRELNATYRGTKFDVPTKYAEMLVVVWLAMLYSGGLPLLLPIASFACGSAFWVNKLMIMYAWRKPPRYGKKLPRFAAATIPYALLLHLLFTIWMYGNAEALQSPSSQTVDDNRFDILAVLSRANVQPLFYFAVLVLVLLLFVALAGEASWRVCLWLFHKCRRSYHRRRQAYRAKQLGPHLKPDFYADWEQHEHQLPPYTGVYEREIPPELPFELPYRLQEQGWLVATKPAPYSSEGHRRFITKVWLEQGETMGVPHAYKQVKRTWEVIRDSCEYESYRYLVKSIYRAADLEDKAQTLQLDYETVAVLPEDEDEIALDPTIV